MAYIVSTFVGDYAVAAYPALVIALGVVDAPGGAVLPQGAYVVSGIVVHFLALIIGTEVYVKVWVVGGGEADWHMMSILWGFGHGG